MNVTVPNYSLERIRAIIGLGNPGEKYTKTRHNIGFRVVDELISVAQATVQTTHGMEYAHVHASLTELSSVVLTGAASHPVYLIKPTTFMNDSGAVVPWLVKKGIKPEEMLIIHDELEKPFGYVELKFGGSAKGHNGLRSFIQRIGMGFWRLRIGIGRPEQKDHVGNYVLQAFNRQEEAALVGVMEKAVQKILT